MVFDLGLGGLASSESPSCMGHSQVAAGVYSQTSSNIVAQKQCQNQNCEYHILSILVGYTVYGCIR